MKTSLNSAPIESTMNSESIDFGIDAAVIPALFDNIYKNKIRTLTQEYLSNARDANREVNQSRPIEVTLPSEFEPSFIIRDFGPGITPDRMSKVFVFIGRSTKRDTNSQTGGFGIGCKSYFSYGETFHVNTFVDGTKRSYTCWKDSEKKLHLDFHSEKTEPTDEPNGTQIILPVFKKDLNEFKQAVFRACYFWKEIERPLIKGIMSEVPFHKTGLRVSTLEIIPNHDIPNYVGLKGYGRLETFCIIDGIPYPLTDSIREKVPKIKETENLLAPNASLAIHLNNGSVGVALSREDIDNSKRTIATLSELFELAFPKISAKRDSLLKYNDFHSFVKVVNEVRKIFVIEEQKFEKYTIIGSFIKNPDFLKINIEQKTISRSKIKSDKLDDLQLNWIGSSKLYYDDSVAESNTRRSKKLKDEIARKNSIILFSAVPERMIWNEEENTLVQKEYSPDENDISNQEFLQYMIKLLNIQPLSSIPYVPRKSSGYGGGGGTRTKKTEVSLHLVSDSRKTVCRYDLDGDFMSDNTIVTIGLEQYQSHKYEISSIKKYLNYMLINDVVFAAVSPNELKKISEFENVMTLDEFKENYEPTASEKLRYLKRKASLISVVNRLKRLDIKNNDLKELIDLYESKVFVSGPSTMSGSEVSMPSFVERSIDNCSDIIDFMDKNKEFSKLIDTEYSLITLSGADNLTFKQKDDMISYLNRKENK